MVSCQPEMPLALVETAARQVLEAIVFERLAKRVQAPGAEEWGNARAAGGTIEVGLWLGRLAERFGTELFEISEDGPTARPRLRVAAEPVQLVRKLLSSNDRLGEAWEEQRDLLGQIHQHLLGHCLVRRGDGLHARSNPGVRKRAGVFYTPACVTQYMVASALVPYLEMLCDRGGDPAGLRILDPACGCGAFLVEAWSRLLEERQGRLPLSPGSAAECIYGVDLDGEAVLTCRRSLWLSGARTGFCARSTDILNRFAGNIRHGDILQGECFAGWDGRFDIVLGNPPYRRELNTKHLLDPLVQTELGRRYRAPRMDFWYYFLHRGLELLKPGGLLAFIVGAYWTAGSGAAKLVRHLQETARIEEIFLLDRTPVFAGVSGRHMILTVRKETAPAATRVKRPRAGDRSSLQALLGEEGRVDCFLKEAGQLFRSGRIDLEPTADAILARIARGVPLGQLGRVRQGIVENPASINRTSNERFPGRWKVGEGVFSLSPRELGALDLPEAEARLVRPYYALSDLGRYYLADVPSRRLIYSTQETWPNLEQFTNLAAHLARFRPVMQGRRETQRGLRPWWQLHWPREESLWESAKIVSLQMGARPAFAAAEGSVYVPFSVNVFVPSAEVREHLYYFAGVLNSRLAWKWYQHHAKRRGAGLEINIQVLSETPVPKIDFGDGVQAGMHGRLVGLVADMLRGTAAVRRAADAVEARRLADQVGSIDAMIDQLVYQLYGLSASEIEAVEKGTRSER